MSLWTDEELSTANRIWKNDPIGRERFLNDLLKKSKEDRKALMERLNKGFWQHLREIFIMGADYVGAAATGEDISLVGAYSDALTLECRIRNDVALYSSGALLAVKATVLVGGLLLINRL